MTSQTDTVFRRRTLSTAAAATAATRAFSQSGKT